MKRSLNALLLFSTLLSPLALMAADFKVHEWGTFTSFMGSNGALIEGLHHEDEPLPAFVHGLKKEEATSYRGLSGNSRCVITEPKMPCRSIRQLTRAHSELFPEAPVSSGITQKMETPVIYFYGDAGKKVNVEINFPQGIITQYFPQATFSYPKLNEVKELKDSRFVFDVNLHSPTDVADLPRTVSNSIWNPARAVPAANTISVNGNEKEKFIFYRGVGNFASPLRVLSNAADVLRLENMATSAISMAIVLNSDGVKGNVQVINNISKDARVSVPDLKAGMSFAAYIAHTKSVIADALISNGLFKDEALAMVNTWEKSYFHTPGIRVLYIVPADETEAILPLTVKPVPQEQVRVLVGRIEVMTVNQEQAYLKELSTNTTGIDKVKMFGRFYEPKLRRLEQIAPESLKLKIRSLL